MSEPQWCTPGPAPEKPDRQSISVRSLCETGWQSLLITGMLRDMFVRHFAEPDNIRTNDLLRHLWTNDERTGILIESVHRWRNELVEKRPAILIKRGPLQEHRLGINNFSGLTEEGNEKFAVMWVGSHTLFCIHGTGASTEILAEEVRRLITRFGSVLRQELMLSEWGGIKVGAISEVEEATENFVVPITVGWAYQEAWRIEYQALPLRRIPLSVLIDWRELDS